jgi:hypothetical protein
VNGFMPMLYDRHERRYLEAAGVFVPKEIPWDFKATHARCMKNHMQTPERLAERGGLGVEEALAVLRDRVNVAPRFELPRHREAWIEHTRAALKELLDHVHGRAKP